MSLFYSLGCSANSFRDSSVRKMLFGQWGSFVSCNTTTGHTRKLKARLMLYPGRKWCVHALQLLSQRLPKWPHFLLENQDKSLFLSSTAGISEWKLALGYTGQHFWLLDKLSHHKVYMRLQNVVSIVHWFHGTLHNITSPKALWEKFTYTLFVQYVP